MTTTQDGSSNNTMDNDLELQISPQPAPADNDIELQISPQPSNNTMDNDLERQNSPQPAHVAIISERALNLYQAALKGDWVAAKMILDKHPDAVRDRITETWETVLHIAAAAKDAKFAIELIRYMKVEHLALKTMDGTTALCTAAISGQVEIAKELLKKKPNLIMTRNDGGFFPLSFAAGFGHKDMTRYLYHATDVNGLPPKDRIELLITMINNNLYDVALDMLQKHLKELATARGLNDETALHALARKPLKASTFDNEICMHPKALELVKCLWEQMILSNITQISNLIEEPWRILYVAAELGNVDFLVALNRSYPILFRKFDTKLGSIFHIAVLHRHENIFVIINEMGAMKDLMLNFMDEDGNNVLHLVGKLAPSSRLNIVSGAALQMQRELLWFKEVEKIVHSGIVEAKNKDGYTPRALFTETHEGLMKQGETWMKGTATSCMLVATLITTMLFAAAFNIPGGRKDTTGDPIYRKKVVFMFFAISDAIGLLSSSTAILTFLSILTSRYAEEDFLESLPKKLVIGIAMLFVSVAAMMVAFCSTFVIVFYHGVEWIAIPIALVACVPVISFGFLQYHLFSDIIQSINRSRFLFRPTKHKFF